MDERVQAQLWDSVMKQNIHELAAALNEGADVNYQYARALLKPLQNTTQYNSKS
jgi:hypothetical protein